MGVDVERLPARDAWLASALQDFERPDRSRSRFYVAWVLGDETVGHSSISHIMFGRRAHVHLHLWRPELRGSGLGPGFLARSIDLYFERFELEQLICEPFADNAGPNRAVARLGFVLEKRYRTTPTEIALEQDVNRYVLERGVWLDHRSEPDA
jgi:RimJ/RimL family protein N-acetyltransferase